MKLIRQFVITITVTAMLALVLVLPAAAEAVTASPTPSAVRIDGTDRKFEAYCINGNNYFKLRDIAYALTGTEKQFQTAYDETLGQVILTSKTAYTAVGGEMAISGSTEIVPATPTSSDVYLDGTKLTLTSYLIGSSTYIKLRDIAAAINFGVWYNAESNVIEIDTSTGYTPEQALITFPCDLNVTFIGDSVGAGAVTSLQKLFPKMYIDAKASRQFTAAKGIIEQLLKENRLYSTVVIQLGTNGTFKESDVRKLIETIGSDRKIVFVNCQVPRSWGLSDNKLLAKVIPEYSDAIIADWYSASLDKKNYFYGDGIHLNKTGAAALAQVIADAIVKIQPYKPYIPVS